MAPTTPNTPQQAARLDRGLTLAKLAEKCAAAGTPASDSHLSRVDRGLCRPRPALRATLKKILGVDPVTSRDQP